MECEDGPVTPLISSFPFPSNLITKQLIVLWRGHVRIRKDKCMQTTRSGSSEVHAVVPRAVRFLQSGSAHPVFPFSKNSTSQFGTFSSLVLPIVRLNDN